MRQRTMRLSATVLYRSILDQTVTSYRSVIPSRKGHALSAQTYAASRYR